MKRNWKKLLVFAILFSLLLVGAAIFLLNSLSVRGSNLEFREATGTVVDCDGTVRWAYIPAEIDGVAVESIASLAFSQCDKLTTVSIPASVIDIGWGAFQDCSSLRGIWVDPNNPAYSSDENGVLFNKDKTQLIFCPTTCEGAYVIPDGVTHISDRAFSGCENLTSVSIPDGVTHIGDRAFSGCESLTSVSIPDGVTHIGDEAFWNCNKLTSVTLPNSVSSIGDGAFAYCAGLTSVTLPNSLTSIGEDTFLFCACLTDVTIPNGVTTIDSSAFRWCQGLTNVTLPSSVSSIGDGAFKWSWCLCGIWVDPNNPTYSSDENGVLYNKDKTQLITCPAAYEGVYVIPDGVTSIGDEAFRDCDNLTSVSIPDSVTHIGDEAFSGCDNLTSVSIPDSVTHISDGAFSSCYNLTSVTIPDSVTHIGDEAFSSCYDLTSVSIPDSVTHIGDGAFSGCDNLRSVSIPDSVTHIGDGAFEWSWRLCGIWVDPNNPTYSSDENGVLYNKDKTQLITCPAAYEGAYVIPDGVTCIGNRAFRNCYDLTSVSIPDSVTHIGDSAFENSGVTAVYFMGNAPELGVGAFDTKERPTIYYIEGTSGWTDPMWNDYPTATWNPDAPGN